jgi:hypothetical protein
MTALAALYNSAAVQIDNNVFVTLLFSLVGLMLSLALLSANPDALAALGAY